MIQLPYQLILASKSPRRQHLLKELGLEFEIQSREVDESFPEDLKAADIALYLAEKKGAAFLPELKDDQLVITADTIVWLKDEVLNKPDDLAAAKKMIGRLSGNKHTVYTAVCLSSTEKQHAFAVSTDVYFKELSTEQIGHYVNQFKPLDKAGAYGIQEWIGYIGIERIDGSFYNVMGLPLLELYEALKEF